VRKVGLFFGAGAEAPFYSMPLGAEFTQQTILTKRKHLYDNLSIFYSNRLESDYVKSYVSQYLFNPDSVAFREIVVRALGQIVEVQRENVDEHTAKLVESAGGWEAVRNELERGQKIGTKEFSELIQASAYQSLIIDESRVSSQDGYESIRPLLSYHGSIEKDFSCISRPHVGPVRFWRLVNYFWSAYFSLVHPILSRSPRYCEDSEYLGDTYGYVLNRLVDITNYIHSDETALATPATPWDRGYYHWLSDSGLDFYCAITTNYTPFVRALGVDKVAYLAGRLSQFEIPNQLRVVDLQKHGETIPEEAVVFPFLLTQAPIKPIIEPRQIEEYARAMSYLEEIDTLIILGYGLNENDDHINSLIRHFISYDGRRIIYCQHEKDRSGPIKRLRLASGSDSRMRIDVMTHNGIPADVTNQLVAKLRKQSP
jgi:hypothetical protein